MKIFLSNFLIVITILFSTNNYSQNNVTTDELKTLYGKWKGTLTYKDFSTNKPFTMPANLTVKQGKNNNQLILNINYPDEPNANSKDKIKISKNGTELNKHDIKSKQELPNGDIQITTQYSGKDNGEKAQIKNIYIIGPTLFIIRTEAKFENSEDWFMRNEYKFLR